MKYFTVVGINSEKVLFAGIVINSQINGNLSDERKKLHKPIRKNDNRFLDHDSFIDCSYMKKVSVEKMKKFSCIDKLDPADLQVAVQTLKGSKFANRSKLKRFVINQTSAEQGKSRAIGRFRGCGLSPTTLQEFLYRAENAEPETAISK